MLRAIRYVQGKCTFKYILMTLIDRENTILRRKRKKMGHNLNTGISLKSI